MKKYIVIACVMVCVIFTAILVGAYLDPNAIVTTQFVVLYTIVMISVPFVGYAVYKETVECEDNKDVKNILKKQSL